MLSERFRSNQGAPAFRCNSNLRLLHSKVFCSSIATVMGPTPRETVRKTPTLKSSENLPPGTGVIQEAIGLQLL